MADAIWKEFELYCPVCDHTFKQLIVLHKVPKDYNLDKILADSIERHDHKAYQDWKAKEGQPKQAE
jgi:hypothetical protein